MYGKAGKSSEALAAYRKGRAARAQQQSESDQAPPSLPERSTEHSPGGSPMGTGPAPAAVDLTQQRKDRAAHALAAVRDLEAAIQAEIQGSDIDANDEVVHMTADWLNDDVIETIEGLT